MIRRGENSGYSYEIVQLQHRAWEDKMKNLLFFFSFLFPIKGRLVHFPNSDLFPKEMAYQQVSKIWPLGHSWLVEAYHLAPDVDV